MIEIPTTLILGAGASMPYGFPSGKKLVEDILKSVGSIVDPTRKSFRKLLNSEFTEMLFDLGYDEDLILRFISNLKYSKIDSIDSFLEIDENAEFLKIGKIFILYALHRYEKSNDLIGNDDWYRILWNTLKTKSSNDFKLNKLSVITYNYDRSLEYYLINCLKHSYGLNDKNAFKLLFDTVKIIHVHGKIGVFGVENHVLDLQIERGFIHDYGDIINSKEKLEFLGNCIKIIHDNNINDSIELDEAVEILKNTERICFLGFGYAQDNLKRLKIQNKDGKKNVLGSAHGLTDLEIDRIILNFPYFRHYIGGSEKYLFNTNAKCDEFLKYHFIL